MDKYQMIDEAIILLDDLADARGARRCGLIVELVKLLDSLKKGLRDESEAHQAQVDMLNAQIRDLTTPPPLEEGQMRVGGQTYTLDFTHKTEDDNGTV